MDHKSELTAQQRAALITVRLLRGEKLTNAQVAEICGYIEPASAYKLMMQLAALHILMPLTYSSGYWFISDNHG